LAVGHFQHQLGYGGVLVGDHGHLGPARCADDPRLQENIGAQNRLRGRETIVHAIIIQILLDWCATASS
jgi:hypothetical protein